MEWMFKRWRWGLFIGGLAFGGYLWFAGADQNLGQAFLRGLVVMSVSFLFVSGDLAYLLASPLLKFIDSIYLPGGHADKMPLKYDLPIYYERHFRAEEAADAYEAIVKAYPRQIHAYAGVIRVSGRQLGDPQRARRWRHEAERLFGRAKVAAAVAKTAEEWHAERLQSAIAAVPSR